MNLFRNLLKVFFNFGIYIYTLPKSRFCRALARLVLILSLGIIGGGIFGILILPKLIGNPAFENSEFKKAFEREIQVFPKEEIYIQENIALKRAVETAEKVVIIISTESKGKKLTDSGLILTSDGMIIALNNVLTSESEIYYQDEKIPFQVLKRDKKKNLVLIKIEKTDLPCLSFADPDKLKLGERVFLIGKRFVPENKIQTVVNQGIIKSFDDKFIKTNIFEDEELRGCPLFDIESNIIGLNIIEKGKEVKTIPISEIRDFTGL